MSALKIQNDPRSIPRRELPESLKKKTTSGHSVGERPLLVEDLDANGHVVARETSGLPAGAELIGAISARQVDDRIPR